MPASALLVSVALLPSLGAWVTYWDRARGLERVEATSVVDDVFFFDGVLSPEGTPRVHSREAELVEALARARAAGKRVWLTVVNDVVSESGAPILKDGDLVHRLLSDEGKRRRHAGEVVGLARRLGVSGIDVDYENLDPGDRESFTSFVQELSRSGLRVSVTAQPKTRDVRSRGAGAVDWAAVCSSVDRLQIMLYNLHSAKTEPGPMATPDWIASVLGYASERCPRARVFPVLKVSGMDWGPRGARGIQHREAVALAAAQGARVLREQTSGVPYFRYRAPDGEHTVFFEDASSLATKLERIEALGFDSVVLWSLGREDHGILDRWSWPRDPSH